MRHGLQTFAVLCFLFLAVTEGTNAEMQLPQDGEIVRGFYTYPLIDGENIYFAGYPDQVYSFNQSLEKSEWSGKLDPPPADFDDSYLPAPSPSIQGSYLLVHIGQELWAISRVDGRTVWHTNQLMDASQKRATCSSNHLPGYYVAGTDDLPLVITLESKSDFWVVRAHMIGNGETNWEFRLKGVPRSWWKDSEKIIIVSVLPDYSLETGGDVGLVQIDIISDKTGLPVLSVASDEKSRYYASMRATGRIFISEVTQLSDFRIRAINESDGQLYSTESYQAGLLVSALESNEKLIFLHSSTDPSSDVLDFRLYHTSLSPIRIQPIYKSRQDQLFSEPRVDGNLLFYAGAAWSLYDGNRVWSNEEQKTIVDWCVDSDQLYAWDRAGFIQCVDRLDGRELWKIPLEVLPPDGYLGPNYGGASLSVSNQTLYITTPMAEMFRINTETGEINSLVIKGINSMKKPDSPKPESTQTPEKHSSNIFTTILMLIGLLAVLYIFYMIYKKRPHQSS